MIPSSLLDSWALLALPLQLLGLLVALFALLIGLARKAPPLLILRWIGAGAIFLAAGLFLAH